MRRAATGLVVALLLAAGAPRAAGQAAAESSEAVVLSLESALAIAREHNRKVASAELEVGKATDRLGALKAQRLPSLSLDATAVRTLNTIEFQVSEGTFGTFSEIGPIPAADTKITTPPKWTAIGLANLKQPLSQLYKIGLGVKAREAQVASAKEDLREGRQTVALQVRKAYYAIVGTESALASARESLALSREIHRVLEQRVAEKAALAYDEVDARAAVARADYQVAALETSLSSSRDQLNVLLGRDVGTEFRVAALPDPRPVSEGQAEAADRAIAHRPDVLRARVQASAADLDARAAKAEYVPDLSLTFNYFHPWQIEFQPKSVWSAGVILQWEVFDGGKRGKELAEKRKTAEQARLAIADAEAAARAESSRLWRQLRDADRLVAAATLARQAMHERLRVFRERYETRAALAQDLLKAQADQAEAEHDFNEALVTYWSTRADYEASVGEDL